MRRRLRLTLSIGVLTVLVLLLAGSLTMYMLLQPDRVTNMLRKRAHQAGMAITLNTAPEPTLWPHPALVLHGLTLSADNRPVLVAARARIALPWRTLLGGDPAITRLELDAPRLHINQLAKVIASNRSGKHQKSPVWPHVSTGMRINNGSIVRNGNVLLNDLHLETGTLQPGHVFNLLLKASSSNSPFKLTLLATPREYDDAIGLENIHLELSTRSERGFTLDGHGRWAGSDEMRLMLNGTVTPNPDQTYRARMQMPPAQNQQAGAIELMLSGSGMNANLTVQPAQLATWWRRMNQSNNNNLPLPPVAGSVHAQQLDVGDTHIEGLNITSGNAAPAANTSSGNPGPAAANTSNGNPEPAAAASAP